jgi:hypothetical protein
VDRLPGGGEEDARLLVRGRPVDDAAEDPGLTADDASKAAISRSISAGSPVPGVGSSVPRSANGARGVGSSPASR